MDSHSRIDESLAGGGCKINRLVSVQDFVLLESSEQRLQHALERFAAAYDEVGTKISTKRSEVLCLSRNPGKCELKVSGNTLQNVEKFK